MKAKLAVSALLIGQGYSNFLPALPHDLNKTTWAFWDYQQSSLAVLPGQFNRSAFDAPWDGNSSDIEVKAVYESLNSTQFVAYDNKFFDIIGSAAAVEHIQALAHQSHEAACYIPDLHKLFFVEWGPPGGNNGTHPWQYMLDVNTNTLSKVQTDPPTINAHGCVYFQGSMYIITDGTDGETGYLAKVDPITLKRETLLNNYYGQPFAGFNDLDIDSDGNFYLTDSKSGWARDIVPYTPPTNPSTYFVNATTMRPKVIQTTTGNCNGVAVSESGSIRTVYLPNTGVSEFKPVSKKNPYGQREIWAYDFSAPAPVLTNPRLLNNPISYFYDGIRVSRNGWIFAGAGDGVDVIDPVTGLTLGTIRVGGGDNLAVTVAFGEHEIWIVGRGGVWHVSNVKETLARTW
ncbi:hypothetical protein H2198_000331 [Neophaeococcomyces mojaviensis]|uniref:Uncharacterized protein n=1 Tax=Neophaeococcomyces mojaviensis TaxID=3383035 RepID=A0ACC3AKC1_9EURO|nr:hypothetical protein H2198_000331 [Knufia sp. JES_112]